MWKTLVKLWSFARRLDMDSPSPSKTCAPLLPWGDSTAWTAENEAALKEFLATPTGVALRNRARAIVFQHAAVAIADSNPYLNGFAAGFNRALNEWLPSLTLSQSSAASQTDTPAEPRGAEEYGVRYAP